MMQCSPQLTEILAQIHEQSAFGSVVGGCDIGVAAVGAPVAIRQVVL